MASFLTNISAQNASRILRTNNLGLQQTLDRLSSGKRIDRAATDAAGLGVANRLGSDIRVANQARRNAFDGTSYLQVADGVLNDVSGMLGRAAELAEQAKGGLLSDGDRSKLNTEFQNIVRTLVDLGQNTQFNGAQVFSDKTLTLSLGAQTSLSFQVGKLSDTPTSALGLTTGHSLATQDLANQAASAVGGALEQVSGMRASVGALMSELHTAANALGIQVENLTAAFAQIQDANIADEVVGLTKYQILNQADISALGQSQRTHQQVLNLLK